MDILLFTKNARKAEYFSLKLNEDGHRTHTVDTLSSVHHTLRFSDPDFVIIDSETFPDPANDYRTIVKMCRRKFMMFYDNELIPLSSANATVWHDTADIIKNMQTMTDDQQSCLAGIIQTLSEIRTHRTLVSGTFPEGTDEERLILKESKLRPPHAQLLSCLLRNTDSDIPAAVLLSMLWSDNPDSHIQTLYAYINQLRTLLESRNIPLVIERRMKGTYRISIKKSCP